MKKKNYVIYTLRMANWLQREGCNLVATSPDFRNPAFKVFYFEDTEFLRKKVTEWIDRRNSGEEIE